MFFIFRIIPDWFWWSLLVAGLSSYFLSYLSPIKTYVLPLKIAGSMVVVVSIFIFGMLYCNNTWKQTAQELQDKVLLMEAKSAEVTKTISEKVTVKTQIIRERGADTIQYIDREVTKYDTSCVIPQEFVNAHNRAAEPPK